MDGSKDPPRAQRGGDEGPNHDGKVDGAGKSGGTPHARGLVGSHLGDESLTRGGNRGDSRTEEWAARHHDRPGRECRADRAASARPHGRREDRSGRQRQAERPQDDAPAPPRDRTPTPELAEDRHRQRGQGHRRSHDPLGQGQSARQGSDRHVEHVLRRVREQGDRDEGAQRRIGEQRRRRHSASYDEAPRDARGRAGAGESKRRARRNCYR